VIPVQKIIETLYHPQLIDIRQELDEKQRREEQG
jgi:hypothetical protein